MDQNTQPGSNLNQDDEKKKRRKKLLILLLVASLLAVLTVAGVALYSVQMANDAINSIEPAPEIIEPEPITLETYTFKSSDEFLELTFDYPSNLNVITQEDALDETIQVRLSEESCGTLSITYMDDPKNTDPETIMAAYFEGSANTSNAVVTPGETKSVAGMDLIEYSYVWSNTYWKDIFVPVEDKLVNLTFDGRCSAAQQEKYGQISSNIVYEIIESIKIVKPIATISSGTPNKV